MLTLKIQKQFKQLSQIFRMHQMRSLIGTVGLTLALCSCGSVQLPITIFEETFYTLEGTNGVHITHLFSSQTSDMSFTTWLNTLSEGQVCVNASTIADFKSELEKACSEIQCNQQAVATLNKAFNRMLVRK